MRRLFIGVLSFCISIVIGYQFLRIPNSQTPRFLGEDTIAGSQIFLMGITYYIMYFLACIFFAVKFSCSQKSEYVIRLLCFFGVTALIGFAINRYLLFYDFSTTGALQ